MYVHTHTQVIQANVLTELSNSVFLLVVLHPRVHEAIHQPHHGEDAAQYGAHLYTSAHIAVLALHCCAQHTHAALGGE